MRLLNLKTLKRHKIKCNASTVIQSCILEAYIYIYIFFGIIWDILMWIVDDIVNLLV